MLAARLSVPTEVVFSTERDAHGAGFPSLLVNGQAVSPADGVILMPADLCASLAGAGLDETVLAGSTEALEVLLGRMMEASSVCAPRTFQV